MDAAVPDDRPSGPATLAIDIGGTRLKAGLMSTTGTFIGAPPVRMNTPKPALPSVVIEALVDLVKPLGAFDRVSVGFPGVVRGGCVLTAPNLGSAEWHGFPLAARMAEASGKPARLLNDASVQALHGTFSPNLGTQVGKDNQVRLLMGFGGPTRRGLSAGANAGYDFIQNALQYGGIQSSYNWDCCGLSVEYRRLALGSVRNENQYSFNFTLAGVGQAGNLKHSERIF